MGACRQRSLPIRACLHTVHGPKIISRQNVSGPTRFKEKSLGNQISYVILAHVALERCGPPPQIISRQRIVRPEPCQEQAPKEPYLVWHCFLCGTTLIESAAEPEYIIA